RWEIETLFSCLKGRGFNLENTRLTDPRRVTSEKIDCGVSYKLLLVLLNG
ncbi:hypothetical protein J973_4206, partial [Acinetobacter baumannii 26016_7]